MDRGSEWEHPGTTGGWSWGHWGLAMQMAASLSLELPRFSWVLLGKACSFHWSHLTK